LQYANKAVELANKYNRQRSLTYAYCWMGEAWYRYGDHIKGLEYLNKALLVAKTIKEPFRTMEIYETMYDCYLLSGDYKNALFYSDQNRRLKDSLQVLTNLKQLGDLQVKYQSAQKDEQIGLLAAESKMKSTELLWIMISSAVVILFFLLLFYQYYTIHKQHREIIEKNDVLNDALSKIAFIQSHEMRKPLASILGLINVIKAEDYEFQKECLLNLEKSANELDQKIRSIVQETDVA
jgi:signal transduction histidine kinase